MKKKLRGIPPYLEFCMVTQGWGGVLQSSQTQAAATTTVFARVTLKNATVTALPTKPNPPSK